MGTRLEQTGLALSFVTIRYSVSNKTRCRWCRRSEWMITDWVNGLDMRADRMIFLLMTVVLVDY